MKTLLLTTVLVLFVLLGTVMANPVTVVELDETQCQKLALAYGTNPNSLTIKDVSVLEVCLALTLEQRTNDTGQPQEPTGLVIRSQSSSTANPDTQAPSAPTSVIIR